MSEEDNQPTHHYTQKMRDAITEIMQCVSSKHHLQICPTSCYGAHGCLKTHKLLKIYREEGEERRNTTQAIGGTGSAFASHGEDENATR